MHEAKIKGSKAEQFQWNRFDVDYKVEYVIFLWQFIGEFVTA